MAGQLDRIENILRHRIGLDPAAIGATMIRRAVELRMNELGLADLETYSFLIRDSQSELQALIEEVVVPESWFFRDEKPFRHFQDHVRAGWLTDPARLPLRVLSIPCAGGEEPYSIVIALEELGLAADRYQVTAVDVSASRLEIARRGVYSDNAYRGCEPTFRERYFRSHPEGFEIDASLGARVRFVLGSILDPALLAGEPVFDVVFCRNLLIYLDETSRFQAILVLDRLLSPDGLLVVGHADRLNQGTVGPAFLPTGDQRAFTHRKAAAIRPSALDGTAMVHTLTPLASQPPSPQPPMLLTRQPQTIAGAAATSRVAEGHSSGRGDQSTQKASSRISMRLESVPEASDLGLLLDRASALANLGRHDEAVVLCEQLVRGQGPSAPAYYLMGVILQSTGNRTKGEECLRKAIYLDPGHDEALLALALSAERRGDAAAAASFRRRAERAILRKGAR
jgi:chemotaxis protein methyltransferase WspC